MGGRVGPRIVFGTLATVCRICLAMADDGPPPSVDETAPAARVEARTLGVLPTKIRFANDTLRGVVDAALIPRLWRESPGKDGQ